MQKVTHQGRDGGMSSGNLRAVTAAVLAAAIVEESARAEPHRIRPRCTVCGREADFVRHATLAKRRRPWRWR